MIAGLEDISSGELRIGGQRMNDKKPRDRDIAMVFQSYALYPNMTVRGEHGLPVAAGQVGLGCHRTEGHRGGQTPGADPVTQPQAGESFRRASGNGSRWAGPSFATRKRF